MHEIIYVKNEKRFVCQYFTSITGFMIIFVGNYKIIYSTCTKYMIVLYENDSSINLDKSLPLNTLLWKFVDKYTLTFPVSFSLE